LQFCAYLLCLWMSTQGATCEPHPRSRGQGGHEPELSLHRAGWVAHGEGHLLRPHSSWSCNRSGPTRHLDTHPAGTSLTSAPSLKEQHKALHVQMQVAHCSVAMDIKPSQLWQTRVRKKQSQISD